MCGRYVVRFNKAAFEETFNVQPPLFESYNLAPTQYAPILWAAEGPTELLEARWGLIPKWVDKPLDFKANLFNARSETILEKPSFKRPFKSQRCIVPASGFYEWKKVGSSKQPYYIHPTDDTPLAFAGLWDHWEKGDEAITSFTILTTAPNELMSNLHERMPVILEKDAFSDWLDPEVDGKDLLDLLRPLEDGRLEAHPVDRRVGRVSENDAGLIEATEDAA
jgi:putative SOS response-associated peptidase YedK